jgi:putative PEP-CTERM system histidine kinase
VPIAASQIILNLSLLAIAFCTVVGVVRYRNPVTRAITVATALASAAYCLLVARLVDLDQPTAGTMWARILMAMTAPALLVGHLFALTVGRADPAGSIRRHRVSLVVQAVVSVLFLGLLPTGHFVEGFAFADGDFAFNLGAAGRLYLTFLLLGTGLIGFRLENTIRGSDPVQRDRMRWLALGVFGVVGYFVYLLTDGAINGRLDRQVLGASLVPVGLAAGLAGWTQMRGGLADAGVHVGRQVVFKSLTFLLVVGYVVLVLLLGEVAEMLGIRPGFIAGATIVIATSTGLAAFLLSTTFRRLLRGVVEKNVYSNRLDYRTWWLRASHELVSGIGVSELILRTQTMLEDLFHSRTITIYLSRRPGEAYVPMNAVLAASPPPDVEAGEPLVAALEGAAEPLVLPDRRDRAAVPELLPILVENEALLKATDGRILAPLKTAERLIGFVVLGPRADGSPYAYEDRSLLETVTLQLAGAIRGAWLTEDLGAAREMEVFSQWAGVVVHDLKNFVSPLKLFVSNARRHLHNPEFREQAIDDIQGVVEKIDGAIHRLTALKHGEEMALAPTDLEWILDSVVTRTGVGQRPGYSVTRNFGGVPPVVGDQLLIDRVLTNLVTNAMEAMPDGGVLTLETEDVREAGSGGRWAVVRVRDTGVGMTAAFLRHRLFQPFATTKKKGWGLGLYQCRSIVEAHGGSLRANSQPGLGTEFRLALPLKLTAARPDERGLPHPADRHGRRPL